VDFRVLGPLEVFDDGVPIRLAGTRPRSLLAIFLSRAGQAVATDRLIDDLWEGQAPESAATALRVHITTLRGALEPRRAPRSPSVRLPAAPRGYRLSIEPDELDAQQFERLVVVARDAADRGQLTQAVTALEDALGLWRGPAFADTRDLSCLNSEVVRLEELQADALEDLCELRLALGEHLGMVGQLETATSAHPLRERLTSYLMIALYRAGRQAEALRAYSRLRETLREELGIEPSPALRELEHAILDQEERLDWKAPDGRDTGYAVSAAPGPPSLVGRESELDALRDAFAAVGEGERRFVVVAGPPGIGKTTLADALVGETRGTSAFALYGRCDVEAVGPYQPFVEAVRAYARLDPEAFAAARDPKFGDLARIVPELAVDQASESLGPDPDRYRLFESVAAVFAATQGPVLLVVDDLHSADADTLLLLRHLVRHPEAGRLMILGAFRDTDITPGHPLSILLHDLDRAGMVQRLDLDGFDPEEVAQYLRAHAPAPLLADVLPFTGAVQDMTGGNPLFVREVMHHLAESEGPFDVEALKTLAPTGVRDLVQQRQVPLSASAASALRLAAVIGQHFSLDLLLKAGDLDDGAGLEAVEEALGARLVVEEAHAIDRFAFTHGLFRNVIYDGISASRRARLHRDVGEALERLGGVTTSAELAHHFVEAASTGVEAKAARYSIAAGDDALAGTAYEDARRHYERALALAQAATLPDGVIGRTQLDLGRALDGAGSADAARDRYRDAADVARSLGDGPLLTDVAAALAGPWVNFGEPNRFLLALLDDALTLVTRDGDLLRRARLLDLKAGALYTEGRSEEEAVLVAEALALGRELGTPEAMLSGLGSRDRSLSHGPEHVPERLELTREMIEIADAAGLDERRLSSRRQRLGTLLDAGALTEFGRELDEYEELAHELRRPAHEWSAATIRATQVLLLGDLDAAAELAEKARELGERTQQLHAFGAHLLQSFAVRFQQGRLGEVADKVEVPSVDYGVLPSWYALMATVLSETGRHAEALQVLERVSPQEFGTIPRDGFWLASVALLAGTAATAGGSEHLPALEDLLLPHADRVVVFGVGGAMFGVTRHWLARLAAADGRTEEAVDHCERALELSCDMGAGFWKAQAQLDLADLLTREYDSERAVTLRAGALEYANRAGSRRLLAQAGAGDSS
jgi:DNA-binding SARP family transcriptional activator